MVENNLFPNKVLYGNAYVPNQKLRNVFSPEEGLRKGTMFPELVSMYNSGQSMEVIEYLKENRGEFR
jgi:hypothetical protein